MIRKARSLKELDFP